MVDLVRSFFRAKSHQGGTIEVCRLGLRPCMDRLRGYRVEPAHVIEFISIIHIGSSPVGNADSQTLRREQNPCPDQTPISLSLYPRCLRGRHARRSALTPMASGAASIRYGGAASVGGTAEALNRILADLCTRGTPKVPTLRSESLASSLRLPSPRISIAWSILSIRIRNCFVLMI